MDSNLHTEPLDCRISAIKVQTRFDESLTTDSLNQRFLFPQVFPNGDQVKSKPSSGKTKNQNNQNALKPNPPPSPTPPHPKRSFQSHPIPHPQHHPNFPWRTTSHHQALLVEPARGLLDQATWWLGRSRFRWFRVGWERLSDGCVCCELRVGGMVERGRRRGMRGRGRGRGQSRAKGKGLLTDYEPQDFDIHKPI